MSEERVRERAGAEEGQLVMPFYLMCDVSGSMMGDMKELNEGVRKLRRAIVAEPVVDDVAQVCIMTFSDTAKVVMPMTQMSDREVPTLSVEGGTNYGSAFRALAQTITADTSDLKAQGFKVYRPCVFFLTDGMPGDRDWHRTFTSTLTYDKAAGTGMKGHPIFVPFGFRAASTDVLKQLAYPPDRGVWYHTKTSAIEEALKGILDVIMNTVVTSGQSVSTGQPALTQQPPSPDSGIDHGGSEYDPDYV